MERLDEASESHLTRT